MVYKVNTRNNYECSNNNLDLGTYQILTKTSMIAVVRFIIS